jgi:predicted dehydrogenase
MNEIRIGIVGAGRGLFVASACTIVGSMRVTAIFDTSEERAEGAAAGIEGCRAFGPEKWEAFLDSGINAAVIASPIPFHAGQSAACLDRGLHVLSEVTAAGTVEEARRLVQAASGSRGSYMLAENCCFLDEAQLFRRMARSGEIGEMYHAEGGYLHDCRSLWRNPDGSFTWRATQLGVYCTHPLGPILDILDDRVAWVSCQALPAATVERDVPGVNNHLMLMRTAGGRSIFLRVDHMSPRPYRCYFHVQGTKGVCEFDLLGAPAATGFSGAESGVPRICLHADEKWEDPAPYRERHLADRTVLPEGAEELGHGTMEYWMMKAWATALLAGRAMPIDVHRGLDYTLPGLLAGESLRRGGDAVAVPDSRTWESR